MTTSIPSLEIYVNEDLKNKIKKYLSQLNPEEVRRVYDAEAKLTNKNTPAVTLQTALILVNQFIERQGNEISYEERKDNFLEKDEKKRRFFYTHKDNGQKYYYLHRQFTREWCSSYIKIHLTQLMESPSLNSQNLANASGQNNTSPSLPALAQVEWLPVTMGSSATTGLFSKMPSHKRQRGSETETEELRDINEKMTKRIETLESQVTLLQNKVDKLSNQLPAPIDLRLNSTPDIRQCKDLIRPDMFLPQNSSGSAFRLFKPLIVIDVKAAMEKEDNRSVPSSVSNP